MLRNKKAQLSHVWKWLLYIPLTAVIVFLITYIPVFVFSDVTNTQNLENIILSERAYHAVSIYDDLIFREYPGHTCSAGCFNQKIIEDAFDSSDSPRNLGFKLTFNKKSIFFNEDFYNDAKPLSPVRYDTFVEVRPVIIKDRKAVDDLVIDQVYSDRRDDFES
ncbi:hypothetical protein KY304_01420 [Candidatus Woesearchaeota archaeon]|nr:hypothetical protein [Candidatus Woesearchaeota archaeon]